MHQLVDAIQMGTHNICLYKDMDKKYTGCNLKITELLDCTLIGVCAVIMSNMVNELNVEYFILSVIIALDKGVYFSKKMYGVHRSRQEWVSGKQFSYFSTKTYVVGTH